MRPKVLLAEPKDFSPQARALLESRCEVVAQVVEPGDLGGAAQDFDAVWVRLAHRIDKTFLEKRGRCRVIATPVTGLDHIDLDACRAAGVTVLSLRGEVEFLKEVRATAELTVALALALMRQVPQAVESVKRGEWQRDLFRGRELHRKTVGLVGVGRLGSIVAGYFAAFGMEVLGFDVRDDFPPGVERVPTLEGLLARSDLVSVHVALTPVTQRMIDGRAFAAMKPGAFLINTSRGGVVDEASMLAALRDGRLAGAALDVLSGEPAVDSSHPVVREAQRRSNLLVVPHIGGNTFESFVKTETFIASKVLEALS